MLNKECIENRNMCDETTTITRATFRSKVAHMVKSVTSTSPLKTAKKAGRAIRTSLRKTYWRIAILAVAIAPVNMVSAANTPDAKWDEIMGFLVPWINRLGGAVILIGGIMFALGFKDDDAESKTRGMKTIIAGCIVMAVGLSSNLFLF